MTPSWQEQNKLCGKVLQNYPCPYCTLYGHHEISLCSPVLGHSQLSYMLLSSYVPRRAESVVLSTELTVLLFPGRFWIFFGYRSGF